MSDTVPLFLADWLWPVFIHFRVDPGNLQRHVPFELDLFDGDADVSLVSCPQARLRPARLGRVGQMLSTPLACHEFLNLRTYVRHQGEPGIYFLAEWIPKYLAAMLGPRLYGLPYRLGRLNYRCQHAMECFSGAVSAGGLHFAYQGGWQRQAGFAQAARGSVAEFLVERYIAWTHRLNVSRRFDVAHQPWAIAPADVHISQRSLLHRFAPWIGDTPVACAHLSPGTTGVRISAPRAFAPVALNRARTACR